MKPNVSHLKSYEKCSFFVPYSVIGVSSKTPLLVHISEEKETESLLPTINDQRDFNSTHDKTLESSELKELSAKNLISTKQELSKLNRNRSLHKPSFTQQTNLDQFLEKIGSFGFYQILQFFLVGIMAISPSNI